MLDLAPPEEVEGEEGVLFGGRRLTEQLRRLGYVWLIATKQGLSFQQPTPIGDIQSQTFLS